MNAVALLSLEPWDEVWRRNQHFAHELVRSGAVTDLLFVEPPLRSAAREFAPEPGIRVVRPRLAVPRTLGGLRFVARSLRSQLADRDVLWINDATLGVHCLGGVPAVYDVTDDWRHFPQPARIARRIVRAEDRLAASARTVVCSAELARRWRERYGVEAPVVENGVDTAAYRGTGRLDLEGPGPHVGYVGSLDEKRLDVPLVLALAADSPGTVHLVGPDHLSDQARSALTAGGVRVEPPVPHEQVPALLNSFDVLICPHLVDPFTTSLNAIKSHEYLATEVPVVATATSGFEALAGAPGFAVVGTAEFAAAVRAAAAHGRVTGRERPASWADRAAQFAALLRG